MEKTISDALRFSNCTNNTTSLNVSGGRDSSFYRHFLHVLGIYIHLTKINVYISFSLNATVVIAFVRIVKNQKFTIPNMMFWIQSMADIILTIAMYMMSLVLEEHFLKRSQSSTTFFLGMVFMKWTSEYLVILTLLFITVERFLCFKFPFWHKKEVSTRRILIAAFLTALLSALPATIIFAHDPPTFAEWVSATRREVIFQGVVILLIILTVFSMLGACYIAIKKSVTSRVSRIDVGIEASNGNKPQLLLRERKRHLRIILIFFTLCTMYTVTYIPFVVTAIISEFKILPIEIRTGRLAIYYATTITNPLVTLFFKEDYRDTLKTCWKTRTMANYITSQDIVPGSVTVSNF